MNLDNWLPEILMIQEYDFRIHQRLPAFVNVKAKQLF